MAFVNIHRALVETFATFNQWLLSNFDCAPGMEAVFKKHRKSYWVEMMQIKVRYNYMSTADCVFRCQRVESVSEPFMRTSKAATNIYIRNKWKWPSKKKSGNSQTKREKKRTEHPVKIIMLKWLCILRHCAKEFLRYENVLYWSEASWIFIVQ